MNERKLDAVGGGHRRQGNAGCLVRTIMFAGRLLATPLGLLLFFRPPAVRYTPDRYKMHLGRNYRQIALLVTAMSVATVALVGLIRYGLYHYPNQKVHQETRPTPLAQPAQLQNMPRLTDKESGQIRASWERQRERLAGYEWVDRDEGVVRIPIDRAMELLAEHELSGKGADGDNE